MDPLAKPTNASSSIHSFDFDGAYGQAYEDLVKQVMPCYEQLPEVALAHLGEFQAGAPTLLVAGAGTGTETIAIASARSSWRIVAVEPSAQMMAILRARVAQTRLEPQITLVHGTVSDLPEGTLYDAATALLVMHLLPDDGTKLLFLTSICARLQVNAPFILVDGQYDASAERSKRMLAAWRTYGRDRGAPEATLERHISAISSGESPFVSESRTLDLLHQAGFGRVDVCLSVFHWTGYVCVRRK
jgi:tRNA (cmo5U34)-methyltransferase